VNGAGDAQGQGIAADPARGSRAAAAERRRFSREQRTTVVSGIVSVVAVIVVLQLWLLVATTNAYLGGERAVAAPAAVASLVCFLLVAGLLRYLYRLDR
jgi:hypothetical protein